MYIITHFIWNAVRKNLQKRLLVVDEAWVMMQNEEAAAFLFGMAKRGRKYFLGLATITQDVGDFVKSRVRYSDYHELESSNAPWSIANRN
jgi:hypothetical protein